MSLRLSGKRSDALAVLVTAQYAQLDLPFEETDDLSSVKSLVGPFAAPSLVLETSRGPIQYASACLRYVMRVKNDGAMGGRTELEVGMHTRVLQSDFQGLISCACLVP